MTGNHPAGRKFEIDTNRGREPDDAAQGSLSAVAAAAKNRDKSSPPVDDLYRRRFGSRRDDRLL